MQTLSQIPAIRPDTLRWAIFLALLASTSALAEHGLEAATGPGGTPLISNNHGVPVIDIVAPNASGLSHNQFLDYNVGNQGLVLNNAVHAGQSQLAGALAANPQFQGQAASTILNEVVDILKKSSFCSSITWPYVRNCSVAYHPTIFFLGPIHAHLSNNRDVVAQETSIL
jgi:hypothetical protein